MLTKCWLCPLRVERIQKNLVELFCHSELRSCTATLDLCYRHFTCRFDLKFKSTALFCYRLLPHDPSETPTTWSPLHSKRPSDQATMASCCGVRRCTSAFTSVARVDKSCSSKRQSSEVLKPPLILRWSNKPFKWQSTKSLSWTHTTPRVDVTSLFNPSQVVAMAQEWDNYPA